MAIRLIVSSGSFSVERGPTNDLVEVKSQADGVLRRLLGRDADIRKDGRGFRCRIGRGVLLNFLNDVYERYGA